MRAASLGGTLQKWIGVLGSEGRLLWMEIPNQEEDVFFKSRYRWSQFLPFPNCWKLFIRLMLKCQDWRKGLCFTQWYQDETVRSCCLSCSALWRHPVAKALGMESVPGLALCGLRHVTMSTSYLHLQLCMGSHFPRSRDSVRINRCWSWRHCVIRIWKYGNQLHCLKADFSKNNSLVLSGLV